MQSTIPEVGKVYVSRINPSIYIYVESVTSVDEDEDAGTDACSFLVEGSDPSARNDTTAMGYEFTSPEWDAHGFTPVPSEQTKG